MSRLQKVRERSGLRREDVASRAGISSDYVRKLENGERAPSLDIARRIADALGVTVDDVFPEPKARTA